MLLMHSIGVVPAVKQQEHAAGHHAGVKNVGPSQVLDLSRPPQQLDNADAQRQQRRQLVLQGFRAGQNVRGRQAAQILAVAAQQQIKRQKNQRRRPQIAHPAALLLQWRLFQAGKAAGQNQQPAGKMMIEKRKFIGYLRRAARHALHVVVDSHGLQREQKKCERLHIFWRNLRV